MKASVKGCCSAGLTVPKLPVSLGSMPVGVRTAEL